MIRYYGLLLLVGFLLGSSPLLGQEICDNAIDDDGDGRIDVNDPDCDCEIVEPKSLIPNPSFEDMECCPSSRSQMTCATDWIQASDATTDYIHTCGWMGWDNLPVPLPIPDGDACIGFRDGRFGNRSNPNWKEYAGACLTSPLKAGVDYKFQFYIGYTFAENSPPLDVTFFGSTSCSNLPFGDGNDALGCPTNGPGWKFLGSVPASGIMEWDQKEINITPDEDIYAIAIGPACARTLGIVNTYYFFDNLVLADQASFDFDIRMTEHPCDPDVTLEVPFSDTLSYQWYKDGIALRGETFSRMSSLYGDGLYQVRIESPNLGCRIAKGFQFIYPNPGSVEEVRLCEGDAFFFNGQDRYTEGIYRDTLQSVDGCDSIVQLNLNVFSNTGDTVDAKVFPGEYYYVEKHRFLNEGTYKVELKSSLGCDSTILLNLEHYSLFAPNAFSPNNDGINDHYSIGGGEELVSISNFRVFNRWGHLMYEGNSLVPNDFNVGWDGWTKGRAAPEGVYVYLANLIYEDGIERVATGTFTLFR